MGHYGYGLKTSQNMASDSIKATVYKNKKKIVLGVPQHFFLGFKGFPIGKMLRNTDISRLFRTSTMSKPSKMNKTIPVDELDILGYSTTD
jgi:hypothetical protein